MRAVTTATAATVLGLDRKKLDNLLSRIGSDRFRPGRQGVERRIPVSMLEEISLTSELSQHLTIPARQAFAIARRLLGRESFAPASQATDAAFIGSLSVGPFVHLGVDLSAFHAELQTRLELAIESQVRPRRGRPQTQRSRLNGRSARGEL